MEKSPFSRKYRIFLRELQNARLEAGVTQQQIAERLDITQSSVSKVERGERRLDVVELLDFCEAIGLPFPSFAARIHQAILASEKKL